MSQRWDPGTPIDLIAPRGEGPVAGLASSDLNATLLTWPAGHELAEHTNAERDVLLIVLAGGGEATVDGHRHALAAGVALLVERGRSRSLRAGDQGVRYLSVHTRRDLQIESPATR